MATGRPKRDGLNVTRKRRADGSIVEYFYDRATKTFLGNDRDKALTRQTVLCGAKAAAAPLPEGTLGWLIESYKKTDKYKALKPNTKALYDIRCAQMNERFGDLMVKSIKPKMITAIRDSMSHQPSKANQTLALFRILLGHAHREMEIIPDNPATRPGRLAAPKRTEVWPDDRIDLFMNAAPANMKLAMALLLHTVQRPSDMLAMDISKVKERDGRLYLELRQEKTEQWVAVPVHRRLEEYLRARLATPIIRKRRDHTGRKVAEEVKYLVPSPEGNRWIRRNFSRAWDAVMRRVNYRLARQMFKDGMTKPEVRAALTDQHRQRRDLRRTGIVRMAEAGATTAQIAAVSGHSIEYCQKILDVYLPRRSEVALGAIRAWENMRDAEKAASNTGTKSENQFAEVPAPSQLNASSSRK